MLKKILAGAACFTLGMAMMALAQNQADLNESASAAFEKADGQLNKVYRELRETLTDAEKEHLKEVQKLWITYRDKEAEFAASLYEGGSMAGMVKVNAATTETESRVAALKSHFREGYSETR